MGNMGGGGPNFVARRMQHCEIDDNCEDTQERRKGLHKKRGQFHTDGVKLDKHSDQSAAKIRPRLFGRPAVLSFLDRSGKDICCLYCEHELCVESTNMHSLGSFEKPSSIQEGKY